MEKGASRDPGATVRTFAPGSRVAAFCYQIKDLDKNRTRDDNAWLVRTFEARPIIKE